MTVKLNPKDKTDNNTQSDISGQFFRKSGRPRDYNSPEEMQIIIDQYFDEISKNTFIIQQVSAGRIVEIKVPEYPTIEDLSDYLGFKTIQSWYNYKERPEFLEVITHAIEKISSVKKKGAAIGVYKENIVSRELGLIEKTEITQKEPVKLIIQDAGEKQVDI